MAQQWKLVGDVGGTNGRFAVVDATTGKLVWRQTLAVEECPDFGDALGAFLHGVAEQGLWEATPVDGCLAVASGDLGQTIAFTNSSWIIDSQAVAQKLQLERVHYLNDFEAIGYAVPDLAQGDWIQIGDGESKADSPMVVLGPGTGLGVCAVVPTGPRVSVLPGEGGHVDFAPVDDTEVEILRLLRTRYSRVSAERVLSGMGLQNLYWSLATLRGVAAATDQPDDLSPAQITAAALAGDDIAVETLRVFFRILGGVTGNFALAFGAHGGVYLAGGILPRLVNELLQSEFRERFLAKGRFESYLQDIPSRLITADDPGLEGAARYLEKGVER